MLVGKNLHDMRGEISPPNDGDILPLNIHRGNPRDRLQWGRLYRPGNRELQGRTLGEFVNEFVRCSLRNNVPSIHDGDAVTQRLRLLHGMCRENNRAASSLQLPQNIPNLQARLGIQGRRELVKE